MRDRPLDEDLVDIACQLRGEVDLQQSVLQEDQRGSNCTFSAVVAAFVMTSCLRHSSRTVLRLGFIRAAASMYRIRSPAVKRYQLAGEEWRGEEDTDQAE